MPGIWLLQKIFWNEELWSKIKYRLFGSCFSADYYVKSFLFPFNTVVELFAALGMWEIYMGF